MSDNTSNRVLDHSPENKRKLEGLESLVERPLGGYAADVEEVSRGDAAKAAKKKRNQRKEKKDRSLVKAERNREAGIVGRPVKNEEHEDGMIVIPIKNEEQEAGIIGRLIKKEEHEFDGAPPKRHRRKLSKDEKEDRRRCPATLKLIPGHEDISDYTDVHASDEDRIETLTDTARGAPPKKRHRRELSKDEKEDRRRCPATLKLIHDYEDMSDYTDVHTPDEDNVETFIYAFRGRLMQG
jgi:hypothetical protein